MSSTSGDERSVFDSNASPKFNAPGHLLIGYPVPGSPLTSGATGLTQLDAAKYANDLLADLDKELQWMVKIEQQLLDQECARDDPKLIRDLYDAQQDINSEVLARQQPIFSLCYQSEQLIEKHGDSLFKEQKELLQQKIPETKARLDAIKKESDWRLRQFNTCMDTQEQYGSRLQDARYWQENVQGELARLQAAVPTSVKPADLGSTANRLKIVEGELYAHQGDLKALSSSAQKFLNTVVGIENAQMAFGQRHGRAASAVAGAGQTSVAVEEAVRGAVRDAVARQNKLAERCRELLDRYNAAAESARVFSERSDRAASQLRAATNQLARLDGHVPTSRAAMQAQADKLAAVSSDLAAMDAQLDAVRDVAQELGGQLEEIGTAPRAVERDVSAPLQALTEQREGLQKRCVAMSEQLQTVIVQSQDLLATLRALDQWLDGAEKRVKGLRPLSLNPDHLVEQERQVKTLEVEISVRQPSLDATERMIEAGDRSSEKEVSRLRQRHTALADTVADRLAATYELADRLHALTRGKRQLNDWISRALESLEGRYFLPLDEERYRDRLDAAKRERNEHLPKMDELRDMAESLLKETSKADADHVRDHLDQLETQWKGLNDTLTCRERELEARQRHGQEYSGSRAAFVAWLADMESRVGNLSSVAVDLQQLERQLDELLPMLNEHEVRSGQLEGLRILGFAYDAVLHGDAPGAATPSHLRKIHMTEVESELDAVSERYNNLRDRLEERKREIENSLSRVSSFLKQMQGLILCLDEKMTSSLPADSLPNDIDEARQALSRRSRSHEELLNLSSSLEDLKQRAAELLRNRDYVAGVTELREQLGQVEKKWAALVAVSEERRDDLQALVKELEEFCSVRDSLRSQMTQKERMISVLGPMVTAPSLVTNQLQQVRVLQEDLEQLRPEAVRLGSVAASLCRRAPGESRIVADVEAVEGQLHRLCDSLRHREEALLGLMGPSANFYELVNRLSDALPELLDRVDEPDSGDQLSNQLDAVEDELREKRREMARASELCRELCATTSDPALQFDLKSKVANLERTAREVQAKVDSRRRALNRGREETARFTARLDDLAAWIEAHRGDARAPSMSSYEKAQLQDARRGLESPTMEKEESLSELHGRQAEVADLQRDAARLREAAPDSVRARNAEPRLAAAKAELEQLEGRLATRYQQLVDVSEQARRFHDAQSRLNAWLTLEEEKLQHVDAESADKDEVQRSLQDVEHMGREARSRRLDADELAALGKELVGAGETDCDEVRRAVDGVNRRLAGIGDRAAELQSRLQDRLRRLQAVGDQLASAAGALSRCEERWEALRRQPPSPETSRDLDRVAAVLEELGLCGAQINGAAAAARELAGEETGALAEKANGLQARAAKLRDGAEMWRDRLKAGEELAGKSKNRADALEMRQAELESEVATMSPAAVEVDALRAQTKDLEKVKEKLQECRDSIDGLAGEADRLRERGFPAPAARLDDRVRQLQAQNERAAKKADEATERAAKNVADVEKFNKMEAELLRGLEATANKGLVSPEGKRKGLAHKLGIKSGKDELKKFQQKHVEPLAEEVEALNAFGRDILGRLPPGVNARKLEHDLDKVNKKMGELKDRVARQEHSLLDSQGLQDRFNPEFRAVNDWIGETQDLLSSQEPPAADYQVVKAQTDEQRLLLKMAKEKQGALETLNDLGIKVIENLPEEEAGHTREDLSDLNRRFMMLLAGVNNRLARLEQAGRLAKDFRDQKDDVLAWIDNAEQRAASLESSATDPSAIQRQIDEHKKLNKDIEKKKVALDNLTNIGKHLMKTGSKDDAESIQEKLSNIKRYYDELQQKGIQRQAQLDSALEPSEGFVRAHKKLEKALPHLEASLRSHRLNAAESEKEVERLENELAEAEPFIDQLKKTGAQLKKILVDDEMALRVCDIMDGDLNRYEQVAEEIGRKAVRFGSSRQHRAEVEKALNAATLWMQAKEAEVKEANERLSADLPTLEKLKGEKEQLDKEWRERRLEMEETMQDARKLLRETSFREQSSLKDALDKGKLHMGTLDALSNEWSDTLNQALPLAREFCDASDTLVAWMDQAEKSIHEADLLNVGADRVRQIQSDTKMNTRRALEEQLEDHKPLVEQLNKTGAAMTPLLKPAEGQAVRERTDECRARYAQLRRLLRGRLFDIEHVLSQTTELTDQLDALGDNIAATDELLKRAEPISAHADKLRSQLNENKGLMEDLEQRRQLLEDIREGAGELSKEAAAVEDRKDAAADEHEDNKKEKYDQMRTRAEELLAQCAQVQQSAASRDRQLNAAASLSDPFWRESQNVRTKLRDLKGSLVHAEAPASESALLADQTEVHERSGQQLDDVQAELAACQRAGAELAEVVDPSERGDVTQALDETERAMEETRRRWDERRAALEQQSRRAAAFESTLAAFMAWEAQQEERVAALGPVAMESERVKRQLDEVKRVKAELEPKQLDVEELNQAGYELTRCTTPDQKSAVEDRLFELNERWDGLLDSVNERQHKIQTTLLNLGEFEAAFNEVLNWIEKSDRALDDVRITSGDPKAIEMEMAKHKMLQGDLTANRDSVHSVLERGKELLRERPDAASPEHARQHLDDLTTKWEALLVKARDRQTELEDALREAVLFHGELQDVLSQLAEVEASLVAGQPLGGLPDSAREQLRRFDDIAAGLERLRPAVGSLRTSGEELLSRATEAAGYRLEKELLTLQQRWDGVQARAGDRKEKLQRTVTEVEKFHADLAKFINWLTQVEKQLNQQRPVSRVVDTLTQQIGEHSALKRDITAHREAMVGLDRTGTHLRYFSQKQDVIIIKNLLASVHHRWERVISRSSERTRHLDFGFRDAKKFHDMWTTLTTWLRQQVAALEDTTSVGNDPLKIKAQIHDHREWQRALGAKQAAFDATRRFGKYLKDRAPRPDHSELTRMLGEMKQLWNAVCARSVERQRLLEEALLQSGQYKEALAALVDWLHRMEPDLAQPRPCRGDAETVAHLVENHRAFEKELERREASVRFVGESAQQLLLRSDEDGTAIQQQLDDLTELWERVCRHTNARSALLLEAERLAGELGDGAKALMDEFAGAEQTLRAFGRAAGEEEEETALAQVIAEQEAFHPSLEAKGPEVERLAALGDEILAQAHPDGEKPVRQWVITLRARFNELVAWSHQRAGALKTNLQELRRRKELHDDLMAFLDETDETLRLQEEEEMPDDFPALRDLMQQQDDLEKRITDRQPDRDLILRHARRKPAPAPSQLPPPKSRSRLRPGKEVPSRSRTPEPDFADPEVTRLHNRWRHVWLQALDRRKRIQDAIDYLNEVERMKNFDFEKWRLRYLQWIHHNKALLMDFFRRKDKDHDGRITRQEFIDGILESKFPTSRLEMEAVADIFDRDRDGFIDYKEFVSALRPPERRPYNSGPNAPKPTDSEKIHDEVQRLAAQCTCHRPYMIEKVGEGKYRFGDSQKLRLVRVLRSTVMVRVGGGWVSLDEFLLKNDPCRAKGRANTELRERFVLADGVAQSMATFKSKSPVGFSSRNESASTQPSSSLYQPHKSFHVHASCTGEASPKFGRRVVSPSCHQHGGLSIPTPSSRHSSRPPSISSDHDAPVASVSVPPVPSTGGESRIPVAQPSLHRRTASSSSSSTPSGLRPPTKITSPRPLRKPRP